MKPTKKIQKTLGGVLLLITIAATSISCKKNNLLDTDKPDQTGGVITPSYPQPSDADAILVAVNSTSSAPITMPTIPGMPAGGEMTLDVGLGIAVFKGNIKAGKVLLNNTELKFTNGVHTWLPDLGNLANPNSSGNLTGINFNGGVKWEITNPNITKSLNTLPGKPRVSSEKKITSSEGYKIINARVSGADKILYAIHANNKSVMKEFDGNSAECQFTASELASLGKTKHAIIQANAYSITSENIDGKKIYFIRQSSYSLSNVEIN